MKLSFNFFLFASSGSVAFFAKSSQSAETGNLRATKSTVRSQPDQQKLRRLTACDRRCARPGATGQPVPNDVEYYDIVSQYVSNPSSSPYGNIINCWDTSAVTNMSWAFYHQLSFNEPIECWDTSNVIDMSNMLQLAELFNQPLNNWNVSKVQYMYNMFSQSGFNQPLSSWDVTNVVDMRQAFNYIQSFNQNLCSWGAQNQILVQENVTDIFAGTACSNTEDPQVAAPVSTWCTTCFADYNGQWNNVGSNAGQSFTAGASWTQTQSSTYTETFTASLSVSAEESATFAGIGEKLSATATSSMSSSAADTLSYAETHSWSYTCQSPICNSGTLFQWIVSATASDGTHQSVQTCNFACVPGTSSVKEPQCPVGYCADNTCQCCNDLWLADDNSPIDNHLMKYNGNGGSCTSFCVGNDLPCNADVTCCSGKCSSEGICQENFSLNQFLHL
jgi:surface protein